MIGGGPFVPAGEQWQLSLAARERIAAKVFAPANVAKLIADRVLAGRVRVQQRQAVELRHTTAAGVLLELLAALGYAAQWMAVVPAESDVDAEPYHELVIGWTPRATGGGIGSLTMARDIVAEAKGRKVA